eukprot:4097456-Prymnesium_polylepis.1
MVADAAASVGLDYKEITDTTWDEHDELIAFRAKKIFRNFQARGEVGLHADRPQAYGASARTTAHR